MSTTINTNTRELNLKKIDFDPFSGPEILKVIQTTESQLEIWLSCIIGGDNASRSYNESISLILDGELDKEAMIYSLKELIKRHELLRSTFSPNGKSIFIYKYLPLTIDYQDLSDSSQEEKNKHISNIHETDSEKIFDLEKGPLFRSYLIKTSENRFFFKLSAHHIICDGWSFGIILENISKIYSAKVKNEIPALDPPISYSQYSKELFEHSNSEEYQETENYWLKQYKNNVPVLNLPTDNPRPITRTFKSERLDFQISKELIEQVKTMGAKSGASLVSTLIASFETYLYLLTKQSTIALGLPAAGQSATGNYELVGHCVNMLPLRSNHTQDIPFVEYLRKRKSEILDDYDHQQFTFGSLLKKLAIARDSSRIPLIPVIFNIDMGMDANVSFSGLKHTLSSDPRSYENFEIFLNITGKEHALIFEWSYNSYLFKSNTIKRMMNEFEVLLKDLAVKPEIKIKDIYNKNLNSTKQFSTWNNTLAEYPKNKIATEFINEAAIKTPNKTAIYFKESELSYSQVNQRSNQLANYLIKSGIQKGDIIGLLVDRSPEMIIAVLAIMKSGAAYLPLDPQYPKGRIIFMLDDSSAKYLISSEKYSLEFSTQANQISIEKILPNLNEYSNKYPTLNINGNDLAYILYTSGSTGKPKGVQIEHHSLTNLLLSVQKEPGITTEDTLLAITTISFDIAGTELFLPLITGASIYLVDSETAKDGRELLQLVQKKKISIMQATPVTWRMMLASGWTEQLPLKIVCTGEAFPKDLAESLIDKGTEIWNGYGPSETTIWSSIKKITTDDDLITIGRPIANTQIYILDENQTSVPDGTSGELYIAGDGLARDYLNRPELTAEKFIDNPFNPGQTKMYRTGDLGYFLENGEIVCLGRIDAQVKIRGHRIELGEIEYSLSQQDGIKEAVVIAHEDNTNDQQSLLAYIVLDEHIKSDKYYPVTKKNEDINILNIPKDQIQTWKNALKEQLPDYMIPILYIALSHLPTTSNGKIDRKKLPKPNKLKPIEIEDSFIAPRDKSEILISNIWSQFLSIDSISINSNFFELGGHSLIALHVMMELEKETGIKLPISTLFENSTIKELAKVLKSATANDKKRIKWDSLVPINKTGIKPPIYIVHGIGLNVLRFEPLKKYMDANQPIYAIQGIGLNGNINNLPNTIEEIAQHYNSEILESDPMGPYILSGYSSGGVIAFEMAKQLIEMGKEVKVLVMIDTILQKNKHTNIHNNTLAEIKTIFEKIFFYTSSFFKYPKRTYKQLNYILKWKLNINPIEEENDYYDKQKETDYFNKQKEIYYSALKKYSFTPINIKIDFLKCKERIHFLDPVWNKYALKGIKTHKIPGDHLSCFSEPNVQKLAKVLQQILNKKTNK